MVSNYILRMFSSIVIVSIFISSIFFSLKSFALLMFIVALLMIWELHTICRKLSRELLMGIVLIMVSVSSLIYIRKFSFEVVIWYFLLIWSFDAAAMVGGKFMGGRHLAQEISPGKTWSGAAFGLYVSTMVAVIFAPILQDNSGHMLIRLNPAICSTIIVVTAHLGDLLESYLKRRHRIKNSGNMIPGHGGVLDRFDSIIISAPVLLFLVNFQ